MTLKTLSEKLEEELVCSFCGRSYKKEENFKKHICKTKKRYEIIETNKGKRGYKIYCIYRKSLGEEVVANKENFILSSSFWPIIKLLDYIDEKGIEERKFLKFVLKYRLSPRSWNSEYIRSRYNIENKKSAIQDVEDSIQYLFKIAKEHDVEINEVLFGLDESYIIQLVESEKISPILIYHSRYLSQLLSNKDIELIEKKQLIEKMQINYIKNNYQRIVSNDQDKKIKELISSYSI